tara:strand:- start:459 stop:1781 length:1323 start_codon:yes stop_codon:yes gene_type:complete
MKKWVDCEDEEAKTVFYFNNNLSQISLTDWDNEITYFDVREVKEMDEEKEQIQFEVTNSAGIDFTLVINFKLKIITLFDFNDRDDWTLMKFSYEKSVLYGSFISDEVEISAWDSARDEYVSVSDGYLENIMNIDLDFNSLSLEYGDTNSVDIDIKYSDFDEENNWVISESTSSEEVKTVLQISDDEALNVVSLYMFTDMQDGRYQRLTSMTNLKKIEKNEESSDKVKKSEILKGTGSGIIFSTDGYIATNYHVIENANEIEVEFKNRGKIRKFNAEVVKSDPTNDLAIIKIDDDSFEDLPPLLYNFKTKTSDIGQSVFALGYPKSNIMGTDLKFTDGKISSRTGAMGDVTNYQTTTPIQSGNSGGPLFDTDGNLIAINSSKMVAEDIDNVSYSIKTIYLIPLIDALPETITLPSSRFLQGKDFTEQFKVLEKYVTLIRVK